MLLMEGRGRLKPVQIRACAGSTGITPAGIKPRHSAFKCPVGLSLEALERITRMRSCSSSSSLHRGASHAPHPGAPRRPYATNVSFFLLPPPPKKKRTLKKPTLPLEKAGVRVRPVQTAGRGDLGEQ